MSKRYINDPLQILQSKKGDLYIKVTDKPEVFEDFLKSLSPGQAIFLNNATEKRERLVEEGKMNEELADKLSFIKYETTMIVES